MEDIMEIFHVTEKKVIRWIPWKSSNCIT
jgi:hypothetical protein